MNWKTILPWAAALLLAIIVIAQNTQIAKGIKDSRAEAEEYASDTQEAVEQAASDTQAGADEIKEKLDDIQNQENSE